MNNLLSINLLKRIDREIIDDGIGSLTAMVIPLENNYAQGLASALEISINEMDADTLEAFKKVSDHLTWQFEANLPVINVKLDVAEKEFDLRDSYLRDDVNTASCSALEDDTPINVRFEFAGFTENNYLNVTALYKAAFSAEDIAAMAAEGVTVTGDGSVFTISATRACRVYFSKPADVVGSYIINYPDVLTIIPA